MTRVTFSLAGMVYKKTIENQGCSLNLDGRAPVTGYMVGLKGFEMTVNILEFNAGHVDGYIRKNLDVLHTRIYFIGTWIANDLVYINISTNIMYKDQALKAAKIEGQLCIWDVERKVEIYQLQES